MTAAQTVEELMKLIDEFGRRKYLEGIAAPHADDHDAGDVRININVMLSAALKNQKDQPAQEPVAWEQRQIKPDGFFGEWQKCREADYVAIRKQPMHWGVKYESRALLDADHHLQTPDAPIAPVHPGSEA